MSSFDWSSIDLKAPCEPIHSATFPVSVNDGETHTLTFDPPLTSLEAVKNAICVYLDTPIDLNWLKAHEVICDLCSFDYETDEEFWAAYLEYAEGSVDARASYLWRYVYMFHVNADGHVFMDCSEMDQKKVVHEQFTAYRGYTQGDTVSASPAGDETITLYYKQDGVSESMQCTLNTTTAKPDDDDEEY